MSKEAYIPEGKAAVMGYDLLLAIDTHDVILEIGSHVSEGRRKWIHLTITPCARFNGVQRFS
jgi:hypothetical protein